MYRKICLEDHVEYPNSLKYHFGHDRKPSALERFLASESLENAAHVFAKAAIGKLAKLLATRHDGASVDRNKPLQAYEVGSLLAIKRRNLTFNEFNAGMAVETQGTSVFGTSMLVAGKSSIKHEKWSMIE
ncbi:hypothetical protein BDV27DRAFT_153218 [Aspergillus caelatus]|uniref:Uncharacterized protein n=1 Tax=Aspergillus caelatus TaxID=61420 RepID=A0A5N7AHJ9_9EURO|nr:uncharacterized protein BDV27DRAFT_153218 [Aspergillus caelatus]KAE8369342.1 hypothetical protein BDV27DRAFT_153218 [Aspergillus caelatus]